jgi:hypothetical protein
MADGEFARSPVLDLAWKTMPPAMHRTVTTAPVIPQIAARAKEAAAKHPDMVRGDQGQVVGVIPEREVYYGPSSGLPELRRFRGATFRIPTLPPRPPSCPPASCRSTQ